MRKPSASLLVAVTVVEVVSGCGDGHAASHERTAEVEARLLEALATSNPVDVIVSLREPAPASAPQPRADQRRALRRVRESLREVAAGGFTPTRQFEHVPAVAGRLSRAGLEALSQDPAVLYISTRRLAPVSARARRAPAAPWVTLPGGQGTDSRCLIGRERWCRKRHLFTSADARAR